MQDAKLEKPEGNVQQTLEASFLWHSAEIVGSLLKNVVPSLLNAVFLVILSGYLVINGYLSKYTHLPLYNISLSQYIAAGLNFFLAVYSIPILVILGLLTIVLVYGVFMAVRAEVIIRRRTSRRDNMQQAQYAELKKLSNQEDIDQWTKKQLDEVAFAFSPAKPIRSLMATYDRVQKPIGTALVIVYLLIAVFGSPFYGAVFYGNSDRILGGGKSTDVIIVFKDSPKNTGWSFSVDATNERSERVKLLLQLSDGVLVWDEAHKMTAEIENDVIQGIIDYSLVTPTTAPGSAPTATANASATPTP